MTEPTRVELDGWIAATGFASGDRVVVGHWRSSPVGAITDVMWARPDGRRLLLAPHRSAAELITAVYDFDEVVVAPVAGDLDDRGLRVDAGSLRLVLRPASWLVPLPGRVPRWLWSLVGAPIARASLGVEVRGTSPTGVREWYRARSWRPLRTAAGSLHGRDLGPMCDVDPPVGVGFSEPPRRPSLTRVSPLLVDDTGMLAPWGP